MVNGWRKAHSYPEISANILPKLGVIVEQANPVFGEPAIPLASAHLYMDNSTPVCWPEWITTRPGLLAGLARRSVRTALAFFERRIEGDYSIMVARCNGTIAREVEKVGFQRIADNQLVLAKTIVKERE